MEIVKETKWLCENAKNLEKFSGQWVMFSVEEGVVGNSASLRSVLKTGRKLRGMDRPFVFHVPSPEEFASPIPSVRKK